MDLKAKKGCVEKGVKTPERKVYPLKVYPCKAKLQTNQRRKKKNTLTQSREVQD